MTQHHLAGRAEAEVLWFQRRSFLQAAAAWAAAGCAGGAQAQTRSNIVELLGDATVNGKPLTAQHTVRAGDQFATGPGSTLTFTLGNSAFHVRQNSTVSLDQGASRQVVSTLRLLTGAVISVWGKGNRRSIVTPTITAGIRGTGVYTEVFAAQEGRTYLCNCYGEVELRAGAQAMLSRSKYHQAFWAQASDKGMPSLTPAKALNHTDEELEYLARLAGQQTAWQISGRKGNKDQEDYSY